MGDRRSRILAGLTAGRGAAGVAIALGSTALVFGLIAWAVVTSSGWDRVRETFFSGAQFRASLPEVSSAFMLNVRIFLIAEAIVLVTALVVAVLRSLPGPVFFPFRALAVVYADVFRGIPTILLIFLLGLGVPALQIDGVPSSEVFWGTVAIVLIYTAYVSEVYRAGIESIHPSQDAAARSLGLTRLQSLRFVVVPQAVRRVVPPLLNDFIGMQKDTALVGSLGIVEAFRQSQIETAASFNFTPYVVAALLFLAITIPLTRLVDLLLSRERRRRQAAEGVL